MTVLFYLLKIIMIVRPQQHWIRLIFVWHGSVLSKIFSRLLLNFLLSIAVIIMLPWYTMLGIKFTLAPFSILGVADMSSVLAGCERIANTPVPFAYTLILHRTVYLFCIMLPFALVVDLHYMTPFISVLISYTFIALDALAEELEDPFGTENNDLPLDAICNAIEIDLLQMNDERDIPEKRIPDKRYQLT
ncbi:hypothetical protein B0C77_20965 [Salmonella enterica subsp. enterica serovar Kentucky]|nr:hypothetical protein [Salmonella enterica subsp. enterica serovar Kentucky]